MDSFKLQSGIGEIYPITEADVIRVIGKRPPHYQCNAAGKANIFAACPACENPIQIIGIFRDQDGAKHPYGKHYKGDVKGIARYCEEDYFNCPYSKPQYRRIPIKRTENSQLAKIMLTTLLEQFDRVIYLLSEDFELHISLNVARHMLKSYISNEGWFYRSATVNNLPWKFAEVEEATRLFGCRIKSGGILAATLREKCPEIKLTPILGNAKEVKIERSGTQFVELFYVVYNHRMITNAKHEHIDELITFRVFRGSAPNIEKIFEKEIRIYPSRFANLIAVKKTKQRNQALLDLAREELSDYLL